MSQRQEFHIDDEKIFPESGQAALIGRQSCCVVLAIVYERHTEDMATKVKINVNTTIYYKTVNIQGKYSSLGEAFEFCWSSFAAEHKTLP